VNTEGYLGKVRQKELRLVRIKLRLTITEITNINSSPTWLIEGPGINHMNESQLIV
jgi:hypothetical protein